MQKMTHVEGQIVCTGGEETSNAKHVGMRRAEGLCSVLIQTPSCDLRQVASLCRVGVSGVGGSALWLCCKLDREEAGCANPGSQWSF